MSETICPASPILIVDDEPEAFNAAEMALLSQGYDNVLFCQDSRQVMSMLHTQDIELVLLDLAMPGLSGEELLPDIIHDFPFLPVIVLTGLIETERVVECVRAGALDYMIKPIDAHRLGTTVRRALERRELSRENSRLRDGILYGDLQHPEAFADIITASPAMQAVFKYIEAIAPSDGCVLITGETGVGKELIARAVHSLSGRTGPLVPVNISGLDDSMFADTLFGHCRGAFTGAELARSGLIQRASGGTLFLDEIGDLSPASQIKLLRLLQEGEYYQVGSDTASFATARILAATCHDLESRVASGSFRKDFFFRLQRHRVHIPPLRHRQDTDLPLLVQHFLAQAAQRLQVQPPTPPPEIFSLLRTHDFPGNVRELQSMLYDAVSRHTGGVLSLHSLRTTTLAPTPGRNLKKAEANPGPENITFPAQLPTIAQATRALIQEALHRAEGNQSLAARMLGVSPQALSQKLKRLRRAETRE